MQYQAKHQQPKQQQQQQQQTKQPQPDGKKRKRGSGDAAKDGSTRKKKSGNAPDTDTTTTTPPAPKLDPKSLPHILPGEKLSDFAARVDREMPLSVMKQSIKAAAPGAPKVREQRLTKHDKRLRRLQSQWREDEEKIQEREAIEREDREAEMEDQLDLWKQWETEAGKSKAKKKVAASQSQKKKKKNKGKSNDGAGSDDDNDGDYDDSDPWAKLNKPERLNRSANLLDVVQAPPQLTKPKEKFKVRGGAKVNVDNVPAAMGSLRRREELADERKSIVEEYRRLMAEKRQ